MHAAVSRPDWDCLYETAAAQSGLFTTRQAGEAGYSSQLLAHHLLAGKVVRVQHGIYRLVHFPPGDHEELVTAWLWSDQAGVVSHETALSMHGISDALPTHVHLSLPLAWRRRRLRVPRGVVLHYEDVPSTDRAWFGPVPITNPCRTLNDCALAGLSPELLASAVQQALRRGLASPRDITHVERALAPFGGVQLPKSRQRRKV